MECATKLSAEKSIFKVQLYCNMKYNGSNLLCALELDYYMSNKSILFYFFKQKRNLVPFTVILAKVLYKILAKVLYCIKWFSLLVFLNNRTTELRGTLEVF